MVFQSYALYPQMTVKGNLSFGLKDAGLPKDEIERRIARTAEILQIEPLLHRKPSQLSGGQRQRVAIGRALVRDVDVFLFDEPLSNLDAKLRSELRVEIKRLHQKLANTMIYVTHDQIEAMTLADRIAVMKGGLIQQLDQPQEIYKRPVNRFVAGFIGSPGMNFLDGEVVVRDGAARFVAEGIDIPLANYKFDAAGAKPGAGACSASARSISACNSGESWPFSASVEVEIVEPMGSDTLVWTRLGRTEPHYPRRLRAHAQCRRHGHGRFRSDERVALRRGVGGTALSPTNTIGLPSARHRRKGMRMNWSFQLYSARNFQPWDKVLKLLGQAGYKEVEGYGGVYADPAGLRKELDKNGLAMPTGHFAIDTLETDFDGARKIADALGIKTDDLPLSERRTLGPRRRPPAGAASASGLPQSARRARKDGYGFAWHNHDFEFKQLADGSVPQEHILSAAPDIGWEAGRRLGRTRRRRSAALDRPARQAHRRRARQGHRQAGRGQGRGRLVGCRPRHDGLGGPHQGIARQDPGEVFRHGAGQSQRHRALRAPLDRVGQEILTGKKY